VDEDGRMREGESVEEIWKSLKKEVKECETKREVKIRGRKARRT